MQHALSRKFGVFVVAFHWVCDGKTRSKVPLNRNLPLKLSLLLSQAASSATPLWL
jgi:hypothetical protein